MKTLRYLLFVILLLPACKSVEPLDKVANRYLEVVGGKQAISGFEQGRFEGDMTMMGIDVPITIYMKKPDMVRVEISMMGQKIIQASNGKKAWTVNPMSGQSGPTEISMDQIQNPDFGDDLFLHIGEPGYEFTYVGEVEVEGETYSQIDVQSPVGFQQHFFSKKTWLRAFAKATVEEGEAAGTEVTTYFDDYKDVDGYTMPHHIRISSEGNDVMVMNISEVDITEIDPTIFDLPEN